MEPVPKTTPYNIYFITRPSAVLRKFTESCKNRHKRTINETKKKTTTSKTMFLPTLIWYYLVLYKMNSMKELMSIKYMIYTLDMDCCLFFDVYEPKKKNISRNLLEDHGIKYSWVQA